MSIDYAALASRSGGVPEDGLHTARLDRAHLHNSDKGSQLITEWQEVGVDVPCFWTSWNRFDSSGLTFTQDFLDGLGVDRSTITDDDEFTDALIAVEHRVYEVTTKSNRGRDGDRWFTSTYVEGPGDTPRDAPAQQVLTDVPIDASDMTTPPTIADDGDIPF
jgi:hypothetical protein